MKRTSLAIAVALCAVLFAADVASGAGFEVAEVSVRQLGNAYAGKAASASDAAIAYFNPAGMTIFKESMVSVPVHLLMTRGSWNDKGSTGNGFPPDNGALPGNDGGDPGGLTVIPNLYFVWAVNEDLRLGLSINAPFGLTTDYDEDWQGRYHALTSSLTTLNVNPSIAYRLDETFSIGAGFSWQHAEAELSQAIDFGSIGAGAGLGTVPQNTDGEVSITGDSDALGWNIGLMIEFSENSRLGVAYRSKILQEIEGDADSTVPSSAAGLKAGGAFKDTGGSTRLKLPDQIYVSYFFKLDENWDFMADITWTGWSYFDEIRIRYDNPNQPQTVMEENWEDTVRYAIGVNYHVNEEIVIRWGGAFDESPIPNETRTPRIPTNDRWWFALGISWQVDETISADFAWMHVFIEDGDIDQTVSTGQRLKGSFEGSADVFGLQVNFSF